VIVQGFLQPLAGEDAARRAGEPQVFADAALFEDEVPRINLCPRSDRRESAAQGQIIGLAVVGKPPELDPGIADAAVELAEQQVLGHLLAGVAIGLDA
jgi:hypothetical protein